MDVNVCVDVGRQAYPGNRMCMCACVCVCVYNMLVCMCFPVDTHASYIHVYMHNLQRNRSQKSEEKVRTGILCTRYQLEVRGGRRPLQLQRDWQSLMGRKVNTCRGKCAECPMIEHIALMTQPCTHAWNYTACDTGYVESVGYLKTMSSFAKSLQRERCDLAMP